MGSTLAWLPALLSTDAQHFRWQTPWYVTSDEIAQIIVGTLGLGAGLLLGLRSRASARTPREPAATADLGRAAKALFFLYCVGYGTWTVSAVVHGMSASLALATLRGVPGAADQSRNALVTVSGVSTLTEVGPCLVAVLAVLWRRGDRHKSMAIAIVVLSTCRAFLNSERISLIMIAIPALVVITLMPRAAPGSSPTVRAGKSLMARAAIVCAPVFLLGWFAITERGRSWNSHYASKFDGGLISFSVDRLVAYYATATNNGVIWRDHYVPTSTYPESTLQGLARAPFLGHFMGWSTSNLRWLGTLSSYANPEFNNPGFFIPTIGEIGTYAYLLFAIIGYVVGRSYSAGRAGHTTLLLGYSFLCVGLLELPRYSYFTSSRLIVGVFALVVVHRMTYVRQARRSRLDEAHALLRRSVPSLRGTS